MPPPDIPISLEVGDFATTGGRFDFQGYDDCSKMIEWSCQTQMMSLKTICNVFGYVFSLKYPKNWHKKFGWLMPPNPTYRLKIPIAPQQITPVCPLVSLRTLSSTHLLLTFRSSSYGPTCKSWGLTSLRVWPLTKTQMDEMKGEFPGDPIKVGSDGNNHF